MLELNLKVIGETRDKVAEFLSFLSAKAASQLRNSTYTSRSYKNGEGWTLGGKMGPPQVVDEATREQHRELAANHRAQAAFKERLDEAVRKQHEIANRLNAEMFKQRQRLVERIERWQGKFRMVKQENNKMRRKQQRKEEAE